MMVEMKATLQIDSKTTKKDLVETLTRLNIPDAATLRVNHYAGDQREPSYTNLIWSWEV